MSDPGVVRRVVVAVVALLAGAGAGGSPAYGATWLILPVDAPVGRSFEAPVARWTAGHRGVDLGAPAGSAVRAAGAGTVTFAGQVADVRAVTIDHGGELETTYTSLADVSVVAGQRVETGTWIGTVGTAHADLAGLHFGVKLHGLYVDPMSMVGPLDSSSAIHLAPLQWRYSDVVPDFFGPIADGAGSHERSCHRIAAAEPESPPNGNIAVAVAGLGSRTTPKVDAVMYEPGPAGLGYPESRIYRFSYRGPDGPRFHEPYLPADTFGDIEGAARRLRGLLERIHSAHPGAAVDLIAHSQGGIVARTYLEHAAEAWDPKLPRVDHVVTFSSPHEGAPLAGARPQLNRSVVGRIALAGGSWWSRNGGPIPDPYAVSVGQLAPGSELLDSLAREDVMFGTRVLSLAIPNDVVVTADRARWAGHASAVAPPTGVNGHEAIVDSGPARAIAHDFLRDGPPLCRDSRDRWGAWVGRAIGWLERHIAERLP